MTEIEQSTDDYHQGLILCVLKNYEICVYAKKKLKYEIMNLYGNKLQKYIIIRKKMFDYRYFVSLNFNENIQKKIFITIRHGDVHCRQQQRKLWEIINLSLKK